MAQASKERKVVLTLPNMGLKDSETDALKKKFHNSIVESLGGQDVLTRRGIVIIIEIVIVYSDPRE
jgi:hypothetical protein